MQLEDMSFLTSISLVSVAVPGLPALIQAVMFKFIYFDILYAELWMPRLMKKIGLNPDLIENDEPINL